MKKSTAFKGVYHGISKFVVLNVIFRPPPTPSLASRGLLPVHSEISYSPVLVDFGALSRTRNLLNTNVKTLPDSFISGDFQVVVMIPPAFFIGDMNFTSEFAYL